MKGIYTILNNKVYRINQNTAVPTVPTFRAPGVSTSVKEDLYNKEASFNVYINTIKKPGTKSNKELYEEMINLILERRITEIPTIQNQFKIYVDYTVFEDNKEVDHQSVMKPIESLDKCYLLGCATNNETVYRRVKTFNPKLLFVTKNSLPHGISANPKKSYTFKINNISLFEDFSERPEVHKSTYEVGYNMGSSTINAALGSMVQIYSTENEGIDIAPMALSYIPRKINLDLDFIWADIIVAYDTKNVDHVVQDIIDNKYPPIGEIVVPSDDDDPDRLIQDDDQKVPADGCYRPDKDGYFSWYERARETNPKSLLVVEDAIPDGNYDVTSMIKKHMVIRDIRDIEVGEYVIFRESFDTLL